MNLLIDTHVFLWMLSEERDFSANARSFLEDAKSNRFFLSDVSAWEVSIKYGLGKLKLPEKPELFFADRVRKAGYRHLPIDLSHVTRVHSLPKIHGDPFDRLLVSQAMVEDMTIISDDPVFKLYEVNTLKLRDIS
ncbi:MAG: type II toxin-antitoxin system VapC family toxin [Pyrinomonadaceae bacterium]